MFTLSCPACQTPLSLDEGYRGMTCRCSACSSLIAIPQDPLSQPATVIQQGRPEVPGGRPAQPAGAAAVSYPGGSGSAAVYPGGHASGSRVEVPPNHPHPSEAPPPLVSIPKRSSYGSKNNKLLLAGLAVPVVLVLGAITAVLLLAGGNGEPVEAATTPDTQSPVLTTAEDTQTVNPSPGNPLNLPNATVLGLPLARHTVVFVDAWQDPDKEPWFSNFQESLNESLQKTSSGRVSLVYLADGKIFEPPRQQVQPGRLLTAAVRNMDRQVQLGPEKGNFWGGLKAALATGADHLILVTNRELWEPAIPGLRSRLKNAGRNVEFDVILFGEPNRSLSVVTGSFNGTVRTVRPEELRRWLREMGGV